MTTRSTWKAFERVVARRTLGRRIPVTGIDRDGADVRHPMFLYQCKLRNTMPVYLVEWLDGIRRVARAENKIGIVIWRRPRMRNDDALVVLRLKDWEDLHGRLPVPGGCPATDAEPVGYGGAGVDPVGGDAQ